MPQYQNLDDIPAKTRIIIGCGCTLSGLVTATMMYVRPERLRVPLWLGLVACACFVIAGLTVILYPFVSAKTYRWFIVILLTAMTVLPLWVALAPGARMCRKIPFIASDVSCRIAFGVGGIALLFMLGIALFQAFRR